MNFLVIYVCVWSVVSLALGFYLEYRRLRGIGSLLSFIAVFLLTALLAKGAGGYPYFAFGLTTFFVGLVVGSLVAGLSTRGKTVKAVDLRQPIKPE